MNAEPFRPNDGNPGVNPALEESLLWKFLHDLFRPPTEDQWNWLRSDPARRVWQMLSKGVEQSVPADLPVPQDFSHYEEGYLAAYDVGFPAPPCPLQESHWRPDQPTSGVLHENILFYQHFGLRVRPGGSLPPDHLLQQLEFLSVLCVHEGTGLERQDASVTAQFARAREDFLARHVRTWIGKAEAKISDLPGFDWQTHWVRMVRLFVLP